MATPIDISNLALGWIGKPAINEFSEATAEAREARRYYDTTRRAFLQSSDWTFARRRVALAQKENAQFQQRWVFTYAQPHDMLQARRIISMRLDTQNNPRPVPFEVREGLVFANVPEAELDYTFDLKDTNQFNPLAVEALAAMLAFRLARTLTRSTRLTGEMRDESREALSQAISADSAQDVGRYSYDADAMLDRNTTGPHPFWSH